MSFFTGELSKLSWMLNLCGPCSFQNDLRTTSERDPSWACSDSIWPDTDVWNCGTQALAVFWLSLVTCRLFNYFQHTQTDRHTHTHTDRQMQQVSFVKRTQTTRLFLCMGLGWQDHVRPKKELHRCIQRRANASIGPQVHRTQQKLQGPFLSDMIITLYS